MYRTWLAKLTRRCWQLRGNRPFPIFFFFFTFLLFPLVKYWLIVSSTKRWLAFTRGEILEEKRSLRFVRTFVITDRLGQRVGDNEGNYVAYTENCSGFLVIKIVYQSVLCYVTRPITSISLVDFDLHEPTGPRTRWQK